MGRSLAYYQRIFQAYLRRDRSQLSFWHETPAVNPAAFQPGSRQFYMTFADKADYPGPFDANGVPLLDYRGRIGRQYNPIAVAQYGLACWNRFQVSGVGCQEGKEGRQTQWLARAISCADWLVEKLVTNDRGIHVWMHEFDWEYFRTLKAPWYSGLAQGQGIALLLKAYQGTSDEKYRRCADSAFESLLTDIKDGGTRFVDQAGDWWIEEYVTDPPTHILNGFMWALWGVYDYWKATESSEARTLWENCLSTIEKNLAKYDCGYWSLYDLAGVGLKNVASPFYHKLHIAQLEVMHGLSGRDIFREYRERWQGYQGRRGNRARALAVKAAFKLVYY